MTYDELKNGLKSLFSTLGAKTSDSNYGVALLDKTSGEPKGLMGMSDLASVLGGMPSMYVNVTDADAAITPGFYQHSNWVSNTPTNSGILIMPYYANGYWKFQLFCDYQSNHMWFRSGSSAGYNAWKQIV